MNLQNVNSQRVNINNYKESIKGTENQIIFLDSIITTDKDLDNLFQAHIQIGRIYYKKKSDYALSKKNLIEAKRIALNLNDNNKVHNTYLKLGFFYKHFNKKDSALIYLNKALKTCNNDLLLTSRVYGNIANLLDDDDDKIDEAIKFYHKSISIGKKVNRALSTTYNNLGGLYIEKNNDSAIYYYKKSLQFTNDTDRKRKELRAFVNLGNAYLNDSTKYNEAFKYLNKARLSAIELNENRLLFYTHFFLADYYKNIKNPQKALHYYHKVLNSPFSLEDKDLHIEILQEMAFFNNKKNNFKKAYYYLQKHHHLKDSIYTLEKNKAFNDIKTKYDVAEKDNQITLLSKEKELAKNKRKTIIITATLLVFILLLLSYFLKNKINTQKIVRKKELKLFEQEIETKKALSLIEGQENERNRLAKELHDGLGGQLAGIKSIIQTITTKNIQEKTKQVGFHLDTSIKNLRNISHDLSAVFLKDKEFDILIQQLIVETFNHKKVKTEISIFPTQKINELSERYKLNIFRILQESFQNILKHSKATYVSVALILDEEITVLIEDNGVGFNTDQKANGIGLQNIKDRIQSLNGTLHIDSQLKKGTTLNLNIPYNDYRNSNSR